METGENSKKLGKVVAKAWSDEAFKAKLKGDPRAALAEMGVETPAGTVVKVVEDTADTVHLVLPLAPPGDLSQDELEKVAGGSPTVIRDIPHR